MRILIITSEYLNPQNTLSSTFELTQAQVLSASFETAILSVNLGDSLSAEIKLFFKKLMGKATGTGYAQIFRSCREIIYFLSGNKIVKRYQIEGIPVYEGIGSFFRSTPDFDINLRAWIKTGFNAYEAYVKENGQPDIIHAHGRFLNAGALALAINKKYGVPYIYTEHCTYYQQGIAPPESKPVLGAVIDKAAAFTVVSPSLLQHVEKFLGHKYSEAIVVPNVLDQVFETPVDTSHTHASPFNFLTVASLESKKGIDILLRAFKKAFDVDPQYILKICGDGPLRQQLVALANSLGLKDVVHFAGYQPKQAVKKLLDEADVFVLASRVETFGVVVIEALSRGCPVIATRSGGPEYIVRADSGIIVEPGNEEELCRALQHIIGHYQDYSRADIHDSAVSRYGAGAFISAMAPLYKKYCSNMTNG